MILIVFLVILPMDPAYSVTQDFIRTSSINCLADHVNKIALNVTCKMALVLNVCLVFIRVSLILLNANYVL